MAEMVLPAVAKSFSTECKKCGTERYHKVLTHLTATSAKIECEICHSKKTFKVGAEKKAKSSTAKVAGAAKVPGAPKVPGTSTSKTAGLERARANRKAAQADALLKAHASEYEKLVEEAGDVHPTGYTMKAKFKAQQLITHPKFGTGVVRMSLPEKIEVVFPDEVRFLVHNRP